jgi:hypothetical protein
MSLMPRAAPGTIRPGQPKADVRLGRAALNHGRPLHGAQTCKTTASHRQATCGPHGGRNVSDTAGGVNDAISRPRPWNDQG